MTGTVVEFSFWVSCASAAFCGFWCTAPEIQIMAGVMCLVGAVVCRPGDGI